MVRICRSILTGTLALSTAACPQRTAEAPGRVERPWREPRSGAGGTAVVDAAPERVERPWREPRSGAGATVVVDAAPGPRPIAALIERNPWIDHREPSFVLYDDGTAIFRTLAGLAEGKLDPAQKSQFVAALVDAGFMDLPLYDDFTGGASDQPQVQVFLLRDGRWKFGAYGGVLSPSGTTSGEPLPRALAVALEAMTHPPIAVRGPWVPKNVRVIFTNCEQPVDGARAWPKDVPAPPVASLREKAPGTERLRLLGAYEHIVSASYEPALRAFLAREPLGQAVRVVDVACSVGLLRQFPGEQLLSDVASCAFARPYAPAHYGGATAPPGCR
jgi:hypothetical protein